MQYSIPINRRLEMTMLNEHLNYCNMTNCNSSICNNIQNPFNEIFIFTQPKRKSKKNKKRRRIKKKIRRRLKKLKHQPHLIILI